MSVILTGRRLQIVMAAPGRPMLWRPLSVDGTTPTPAPTPTPTPTPTPDPTPNPTPGLQVVPGLAGWWDAAVPSGLLTASGGTASAFGTLVSGIADKAGASGPLAVWHAASSGTSPPVGTPRLSGLLGGVGRNMVVPPALPAAGQQLPAMDPDQGLASAALALGSASPWTIYLVWSRPNWRQASNGASTLLSVGGVPVLAADNKGGTNRLVLFPGASQTVVSSSLTRRHTHAVILRHTPGAGVDAWLDSVQVAAGAPNPMAASVAAPLLFLHNGGANGGAECWFHEAAIWTNSVPSTGIAAILGWQARWARGPRKGVQIFVTGQSNAGFGLLDGAWHLLAQGVAWHLGALGFGVVGAYGVTCRPGEGLYPVAGTSLPGSFLNNPNDGSDPSTWGLGGDGLAVQTYLQFSIDPADAADIAAILWPWSEDDSTRQYSEKATYEAAARRFLTLERGMLSRSAASLPQVWWSAIPFGYSNNDIGTQMQREAVADLAADASQNVTVVLPQTADSLPRGVASYDPATGLFSGGDWLHRDAGDNQRFGRLAAPLVARAILASGGGDTIASIPAGVPAAGGPAVTHVYRESATSLVITVRHDGGTDLIVPATQAAAGAGWAVMDGGTPAFPGRIVTATACVRIDATHLRVTLAQGLVNASASCRLFYPYGTATIGRGNAVTDNLSVAAPPSGWNIGADLGSDWSLNMPVHIPMAPSSGMVLSDTP